MIRKLSALATALLLINGGGLALAQHDHGGSGGSTGSGGGGEGGTSGDTGAGSVIVKKEPKRWAGSEVTIYFAFSAISLDQSAELTYNPEFYNAFSFDPTWRLTDKIQLGAHWGVETELTNNDVTSTRREPLIEDLSFSADYKLPVLPKKINESAGVRLTLPISKESLARNRLFGLSAGYTLSRGFELADGIVLTPSTGLRVSWTPALTTSLEYDSNPIRGCATTFDFDCTDLEFSPVRSTAYSLTEMVGASLTLPYDLSAVMQIWWVQGRLYDLTAGEDDFGNPIPTTDGANWRYSNRYILQLAWQAHPHVRVSGGFNTINPQQKPDSSYYAPFFNRYTAVVVNAAYVF